MGFFGKLLNRPFSQDQFAKLLLKRIRTSGDHSPVEYDAANFRLVRSEDNFMFLGNVYQEFLRLERDGRETFFQKFLATWHTSSKPIPEDFEDVRADILPALRSRSFVEFEIRRAVLGKDVLTPVHQVIGEHLALCLVYDLPTSMMTLNDEQLEKWGVTFYEAMEVAKQNLAATTTQYAQLGPVYAVMHGDSYDATRLVLTDFIRQLQVNGEPMAMVPNRERLYITGSEDEAGLEIMSDLAAKDLEHERWISGAAFRLDGDEWQPWLPETKHRLHPIFKKQWLQTLGQTYAIQAEVLNARHKKEGLDVFVASYTATQNEKTGELTSYCVWSEGVDSLLPETERVFLFRPSGGSDGNVVASGEWENVRNVVGDLMVPADLYPERWRVREFPSESQLKELSALEASK